MVNKNNERIYITFNKKQAEWLRKTAKQCNLQISAFVKWLIDKNLAKYFANLDKKSEEIIKVIKSNPVSKEEWDALFIEETEEEQQEDELPF